MYAVSRHKEVRETLKYRIIYNIALFPSLQFIKERHM